MKKKVLKKSLALWLMLMMVFSMIPMNVFAGEVDTKTVYFTISNAGEIQT